MGKRARAAFRAEDKKVAASKRRPTTATSRKQLDNDVDARMDAVTAEHKRSQPRITRVGRVGTAAQRSRQRAEDGEESADAVDAFMQQRDRIALNAEDDDEDDMDDEDDPNARVLDLPEDDVEAEDDEADEDDEEEADEDELYADEPEDAFRPLPVDDILGEDDEQRRQRSLREEERLTTAWGNNKRLYYSADTADFELQSDDEAARDEEDEADRLLKKQLAQRSESDYTLVELMALNAATPSASTEAAGGVSSRGKGKRAKADVVSLFDQLGDDDDTQQVEQVERVDAMSEREKLKAITARAPELVGLMEEMTERVAEVEAERAKAVDAAMSEEERGRREKCMSALELALTMYVSAGVMYLALRAEGRQLDTHLINQQLATVRAQLTQLLAVKDTFSRRPLQETKQDKRRAEDVEDGVAEESKQQHEQEVGEEADEDGGVEGMDDKAESDESLEVDEEDDEKEEKRPTPAAKKVDIFSSLKPTLRAVRASAPAINFSRPSAHNPFAGLEDDADLPAQSWAKKRKVQATITPTTRAADEWKSSADNFDDDDEDLFGPAVGGTANGADDEDEDDSMRLYDQLQAQQNNKKRLQQQQKQARSQPSSATLSRPANAGQSLLPADHRPISTLMDRNEGLKPSRPKDRKTPKTRNRARYEKAMVKRRSQVREYQGQGGVYGGEATGIRRNVAKSVRLKG